VPISVPSRSETRRKTIRTVWKTSYRRRHRYGEPEPSWRLSRILDNRKDGSRGRLRIDYGDPRAAETSEPAVAWLWHYVDGAKSAGELYGRALVVIAAEHYATQLVVPHGQRGFRQHWGSHKDQAIKALEKLAGRTCRRR